MLIFAPDHFTMYITHDMFNTGMVNVYAWTNPTQNPNPLAQP